MYFCANNPALNTDNFSCPFKDLIIKTPPIKVIEQILPLYVVYQSVVFNVNNVKYYALFVSSFTTYI